LEEFYRAGKLWPVLRLVQHPIVDDILLELRDQRTTPERFRQLAGRISVFLAAEALREVPTMPATVQTPLGPAEGRRCHADIVLAPVLRAGLGIARAGRSHRAAAGRAHGGGFEVLREAAAAAGR
jgi:uracil phosphoribosyltransferase